MARVKTIIVVCLALISLCSIARASTEPLRIINTFGDGAAVRTAVNDFGRLENVPVSVKYMRQDEFKTNLILLIEKSAIADIVIVPADHLGLHDLANYSVVAPDSLDTKIASRLWDTTVSDGAIRGIPLNQGNHLVMYYNKAIINRPAKTWDEIFDQKMLFDKKSISTIQWNHDDAFYFLPFLSAFDGWPLVDGKIQLNTNAMVEALSYYKVLRDKKLYSQTCDYECAASLFISGKLAYNINGTWAGENYYRILGENLGVAPLPAIDGRPMLPSFSTYVIAFPNNSLMGPKKDQIIAFVNFLLSRDAQLSMWAQAGAIPTETSAFKYALTHSEGYLQDTLKQLDATKPLPADQAMTYLWDAILKGLMRQNVGVMDSKQAAEYMQKLAERHARNSMQRIDHSN